MPHKSPSQHGISKQDPRGVCWHCPGSVCTTLIVVEVRVAELVVSVVGNSVVGSSVVTGLCVVVVFVLVVGARVGSVASVASPKHVKAKSVQQVPPIWHKTSQ